MADWYFWRREAFYHSNFWISETSLWCEYDRLPCKFSITPDSIDIFKKYVHHPTMLCSEREKCNENEKVHHMQAFSELKQNIDMSSCTPISFNISSSTHSSWSQQNDESHDLNFKAHHSIRFEKFALERYDNAYYILFALETGSEE
jgi:hypothetical protein